MDETNILPNDAPINEATQPSETLESFGAKIAAQNGYNPSDPSTQQAITRGVTLARNQMPGMNDQQILAELKKQGPAIAKQLVPKFQTLQGFDANKYQGLQDNLNTEYGGEAEVAQRQKLRDRDIGIEAGRALSMGQRLAAGKEYQGALDEQYNSAKAANRDEVMGDWEVRRKAKVNEMEQMIKNGQINRDQVQAEINDFALQQLRTESATKEAALKAANDPNSLVSQGARHLAQIAYPKIVTQLPGFEQLTKQQIIDTLPGIEKRIEANEKQGLEQLKAAESSKQKQLDRESRERIAQTRAGGKDGGPKASDVIRVEAESGKLDKQQREVGEKKAAAEESIKLFDEMGDLVNNGMTTGPIVGGDNVIGKGFEVFSQDRQRARQIAAQLQSAMAKTFGNAPSDAEGRLIREANNIMLQDNPAPALEALRSKFQRQVELHNQEIADIESRKSNLNAAVGKQSLPGAVSSTTPRTAARLPSVNNKGWRLKEDAAGNRAYVSPDGKDYEEVR